MGIILTNDEAAFKPIRPKSPTMTPDEVEEMETRRKRVKKLPADNTGATMTMNKNMFVQGGAEVRPNGMAKQETAEEMCATCMKETLADYQAFYMKSQAYHWNVMGQDFAQYHELFEEIYKDAHSAIDPLGEFIRALGFMTPFTMEMLMPMTKIQNAPVQPTPQGMANDLYLANVYMLDKLHMGFMKAEAAMQHGLSNFLQDRIAMHQKWNWQLGASLGMPDFAKEAPMKTEDGMKYPADAFAYAPDKAMPSTWKLRLWESPDKKETKRQIGMAVAALGAGFRGNKVEIPEGDRSKVVARVRSAWNKVNDGSAEIPAVLKVLEELAR